MLKADFFGEDHFPEEWDEEDFEFLAGFVQTQFDADLVKPINDPDGYDYYLLTEEEK